MMPRCLLPMLLIVTLLFPITGFAQSESVQTYTSSDGAMTFDYPAEWLLTDQYPYGILVANSPFALENSVEALGREDIQIGVIVLKLDDLFRDPVPVSDALEFAELLQHNVQGEQDYVVQSAALLAACEQRSEESPGVAF